MDTLEIAGTGLIEAHTVSGEVLVPPEPLTMRRIQAASGRHYKLSHKELLSPRRLANFVRARQVSMYLCRILLKRSLPEIGRYTGGRDHTTVLHGVRKMAWLLGDRTQGRPKHMRHLPNSVDEDLLAQVQAIMGELGQPMSQLQLETADL